MKVLQIKTTFLVSDEDVRYAIPCVGSPNPSKASSNIKHILKTKKYVNIAIIQKESLANTSI